ncbi:hypothetical protein PORY_001538 [Pneumocystis oryctolagi]|uniref:Uncharacterized protein n=1 Tax=Pneumocystis oryctolagi TaxID=42067 RepID=A0ACB7CD33_9ASCO|nr:hypothetical protein PORY_001538 [Pneumocystis oryctolagi]
MSDPNTIAQLLSALTRQQPTMTPIVPHAHEAEPLNIPANNAINGSLSNSFNGSFDTISLNLEHVRPSSSGTLSLANIMSNINQPSQMIGTGLYSSNKLHISETYRTSKDPGYDDIRSRREDFYDREWRDRGMSKIQRRRVKCTKDRSISPMRKKSSKKPKVTETVKIETNFVGLIIGRGGESLKHIEQETGARVQFYPERTSTMNQRMATISGTQAQVDTAKKRIFSVIEENKILKSLASNMKNNIENLTKSTQANGYSSVQIYIPNKAVGMVIGRGGESIRDLQERSKTYINIAHENETIHGMRPAYIFGTTESIQVAKDMIDEIIKTDSVISFEDENSSDITSQISNIVTQITQKKPENPDPNDPLKSELEVHTDIQRTDNDNLSFKHPTSFLETIPKEEKNKKNKERQYDIPIKTTHNLAIPEWFFKKNVFLYDSIKSKEQDSKTEHNVFESDLYYINVFQDHFAVTRKLIHELIAHLNTSFILNPNKKNENNSSRKTNLMLTCPIKGSVYFLDSIVHEVSNLLEADLIKISPQDLEDLVGDIFEEDRIGIFNTDVFRSLSFTAQNKKQSVQENEEAEEDDIDGEEEDIPEINLNHNTGKKIVLGPVLQILTASLSKNSNNKGFQDTLQSLKPVQNNIGFHEKLFLILSKLSMSNLKKRKFQSTLSSEKTPLCSQRKTIIYIQEYSLLINSVSGNYVLKVLWEAVHARRKKGENIVIIAGSHKENIDCTDLMIRNDALLAIDQFYRNIFIVPITPKDQDNLYINKIFDKHHAIRIKEINIRHLNSLLKRRCGIKFELDISKFLHSNSELFPNIQNEIWSFDFIHRIVSVAIGLHENSKINKKTISLDTLDISNAIKLIKENEETKKSWKAASKYQQEKCDQGQLEENKKKQRPIDLNNLDCNKYEKRLLSNVVNPEMISTGFDSVRAPSSTKNILQTLISLPLKEPEAFNFGILSRSRISGVLLFGPPGSGKTLLAKAVAKDCGARVLEIKGSEVFNMYVGESEKNVKAIFSLARKLSPCVVFIDEVDAIFASRRSDYNNPSHREVINQFMSEWDGLVSQNMGVMIMGATNRPFDLDEAVIRRMPKRILVDLPTEEDREEILKIHLKDETLADDVDFSELSQKTILFSGSDLKNLCVAAALASINENIQNENKSYSRILKKSHFESALNEITSSISSDMSSLIELRKWDEKYGKKKDIFKKTWGFGDVNISDSSKLRVRKSDNT